MIRIYAKGIGASKAALSAFPRQDYKPLREKLMVSFFDSATICVSKLVNHPRNRPLEASILSIEKHS
jgi:hypothetical protein